MPEIKRFFAQFRPTLVLYEGGVSTNLRDQDDAILRGGEMGLVQWLVKKLPDSSCHSRHLVRESPPADHKAHKIAFPAPASE